MSKIYGVDSEQIVEASLDAALEKAELPNDGDVSDKVGRIVAYCRKRKEDSGEPLLQCEECGGVSVDVFDGCPYCGAQDPDEAEDNEEDNNEEDNNEDEMKTTTKTKPKAEPKAEPKVAPKAKAEPKVAPKAKAEPKVAPKAKAEPKAPEPKLATVPKAKLKAVKAELVVDVDPRFTINDLNTAVERANELTRAGAVVAYELGVQLHSIHKDQLWKLRRGPDGGTLYKSFEQFVAKELEISRTTAYEQIDVSLNYGKDDVEKVGYKKLALLLKAPEPVRKSLKEQAEKGRSYRELASDVKEAKLSIGDDGSKRDTGRKPTPKGKDGGAKSKDKGTDKITVASLLGKQTVSLYKSLKKSGSKEPVPATSLEDAPWGIVEMPNGVVEVFNLTTNSQGQLIIQIKRERAPKK